MGCPFGCSQAYKQSESIKRSTAYYQTPEGKEKKKQLNAKAKKEDKPETEEQRDSSSQNKNINIEPHTINGPPSQNNRSDKNETIELNNKMLHYLQCLFNLIEPYFFTYQQILALLNKKIRQHRLRKRKEMDYVIDYCCSKPP